MKKKERIMAIIWILLGLVISVSSSIFPFGSMEDPGPAFFPLGCGAILIALGGIMFFLAKKDGEEAAQKRVESLLPRGDAGKRFYFGLGVMFLSAALFETLGFVITSFFMILSLIRITDPGRKWSSILFYSAVSAIGSFIVFKVLLKAQLPVGFSL